MNICLWQILVVFKQYTFSSSRRRAGLSDRLEAVVVAFEGLHGANNGKDESAAHVYVSNL